MLSILTVCVLWGVAFGLVGWLFFPAWAVELTLVIKSANIQALGPS